MLDADVVAVSPSSVYRILPSSPRIKGKVEVCVFVVRKFPIFDKPGA